MCLAPAKASDMVTKGEHGSHDESISLIAPAINPKKSVYVYRKHMCTYKSTTVAQLHVGIPDKSDVQCCGICYL